MGDERKRKAGVPPLQAVGRLIRLAREQRGLTVEWLSEQTKVSRSNIAHIEAGEFHRIPGRSYVLGFTRSLCAALRLDSAGIIRTVKAEMYAEYSRPDEN